jgi:hypothetical protein
VQLRCKPKPISNALINSLMTYTYGHWHSPIQFNQDDFIGFIYLITHIPTNKKYIGRKQLVKSRRKQVKCITKPGKRTKIVRTQSNWMEYTSSSKTLNADIIKWGKDQFHFQILSLHTSKSSLAYEETYQLITNNALTTPNWYNQSIPSVRCRPT